MNMTPHENKGKTYSICEITLRATACYYQNRTTFFFTHKDLLHNKTGTSVVTSQNDTVVMAFQTEFCLLSPMFRS